jgi:hypothetical protein
MPFLGSQPAEVALTTGDLGADIVTGAKIADDQINSEHYVAGSVDLEHMSSESVDEDNLHISNAGSNGQFLSKQSGDAGGLTWAAAGGNSTLVSTVAAAAQTTISFTGLGSTVAAYEFDLVLHPSANSVYLDMITGTGSTSYVTSGYGWNNFGSRLDSAGVNVLAATSSASMQIGANASTNYLGTDAGEGISARVVFVPQQGDASYPRFFWRGIMLGEDAYTGYSFVGTGSILSTTAVTAVQFGLTGAGNFAGGFITCRSYSKS